MDMLPLLHVPPVVVLESMAFAPVHTVDGPVMAAGSGLTVNGNVLKQPLLIL